MYALYVGFTPPTSGTATIGGYDIQTDMCQVSQIVGFCPHYDPLFEDLTLEENLVFFAMVILFILRIHCMTSISLCMCLCLYLTVCLFDCMSLSPSLPPLSLSLSLSLFLSLSLSRASSLSLSFSLSLSLSHLSLPFSQISNI